ncbi:MAG TPA: UDP-N-acetylmuramoyl-tripeptide--D-alanyl-D-alanine ligase [Candidatus Pacearchaeota archaeon]|nr:UDP-N-acetylmuramoyl-tripeptide--D-alanyl-D-alanine ligase [Candidatus Pacearchaeota archaeon]HPR80232.1 UDP-N-acetylmuramoyl-tripeptide--D-alanyl-D-alanine ligase [Candidatus Pacearchaeota archaeon]
MDIQPWMPVLIGLIVLFFWFFKEVKSFLFWSYLWQLKNYHIGRFLAHFDTYAGKKIIRNWGLFFKCFVFLAILFVMSSATYLYPDFINESLSKITLFVMAYIPVVFLLYIIEGFLSIIGLLRRRIKVPEMTSKMSLLLPIIFIPLGIITVVLGVIFYQNYMNPTEWMVFDLIYFALTILAFDILTPLIVSLTVLFLQPATVFMRNRIIKKATKKREALENLLVIGITGSYGKSSTKEFLKEILSVDFKIVSTEKNENSEIGISQCILNHVNDEHEIFICEMGAYNRGGIKLLCNIAKPKIGILTGINNQHLATFGSQKNIVKGKFELIDSLPSEGLAVLNWDNDLIKDNFNSTVSSVKYSISEKQDVWAEEIKEDKEGISFRVVFKTKESHFFKTNIHGIHNVYNLLAAIAVAKKLGMDLEVIADKVKEIKGGISIKRVDNFDVIDATYSSNFDGIISHLEYLKNWNGRKILVMPCLIELGNEGKEAHHKIGRKIGEVCDLAIITSRDYFKDLKKGAIESGMKAEDILFIQNGDKILKKVISIANEGSVVLLESRVPRLLIDKLIK